MNLTNIGHDSGQKTKILQRLIPMNLCETIFNFRQIKKLTMTLYLDIQGGPERTERL